MAQPQETWQSKPPHRGGYDWATITTRLRSRPGQWLLIAEQRPRSVRSAIRRGRIKAVAGDKKWVYDVRTSNTHGELADIWMSATRREDT